MDLQLIATDLITKHERKTNHLANVLRGTARSHYQAGVSDLLRAVQEMAVRQAAGEAPIRDPVTAPSGVQANHAASEVSE